jgi:hypothetical protein
MGARKNAYLVTGGVLSHLGATYEDIPIGPKLMWLRYAHEALRAERYHSRVHRYVFEGRVALAAPADLALLQGLQEVFTVKQRGDQITPAIQERVLTPLRAVLTRVFVPSPETQLHMNLTGPAWTQTQLALRVTHVIPSWPMGFHASTADGLHRFIILLLNGAAGFGSQQPTHVRITYIGPQRFDTYGTATDRDEGGYLFGEDTD